MERYRNASSLFFILFVLLVLSPTFKKSCTRHHLGLRFAPLTQCIYEGQLGLRFAINKYNLLRYRKLIEGGENSHRIGTMIWHDMGPRINHSALDHAACGENELAFRALEEEWNVDIYYLFGGLLKQSRLAPHIDLRREAVHAVVESRWVLLFDQFEHFRSSRLLL